MLILPGKVLTCRWIMLLVFAVNVSCLLILRASPLLPFFSRPNFPISRTWGVIWRWYIPSWISPTTLRACQKCFAFSASKNFRRIRSSPRILSMKVVVRMQLHLLHIFKLFYILSMIWFIVDASFRFPFLSANRQGRPQFVQVSVSLRITHRRYGYDARL